jgi:hypothetical protein
MAISASLEHVNWNMSVRSVPHERKRRWLNGTESRYLAINSQKIFLSELQDLIGTKSAEIE